MLVTAAAREAFDAALAESLVGTGAELTPVDLGLAAARQRPASTPPPVSPERVVEKAERTTADLDDAAQKATIEDALVRAGGVVSKAAAELGLSRQGLYRRMERLGIVLERRPR